MPERLNLSLRQFESLIEEALDEIDEFKDEIQNLSIVVEDEPSEDDYEYGEDEESELLGIFRGAARTEQSFSDIPGLPPQIAIFRGPILRMCSSREEAVEEIRKTLLHELGHYFGMEEDDLDHL